MKRFAAVVGLVLAASPVWPQEKPAQVTGGEVVLGFHLTLPESDSDRRTAALALYANQTELKTTRWEFDGICISEAALTGMARTKQTLVNSDSRELIASELLLKNLPMDQLKTHFGGLEVWVNGNLLTKDLWNENLTQTWTPSIENRAGRAIVMELAPSPTGPCRLQVTTHRHCGPWSEATTTQRRAWIGCVLGTDECGRIIWGSQLCTRVYTRRSRQCYLDIFHFYVPQQPGFACPPAQYANTITLPPETRVSIIDTDCGECADPDDRQ